MLFFFFLQFYLKINELTNWNKSKTGSSKESFRIYKWTSYFNGIDSKSNKSYRTNNNYIDDDQENAQWAGIKNGRPSFGVITRFGGLWRHTDSFGHFLFSFGQLTRKTPGASMRMIQLPGVNANGSAKPSPGTVRNDGCGLAGKTTSLLCSAAGAQTWHLMRHLYECQCRSISDSQLECRDLKSGSYQHGMPRELQFGGFLCEIRAILLLHLTWLFFFFCSEVEHTN